MDEPTPSKETFISLINLQPRIVKDYHDQPRQSHPSTRRERMTLKIDLARAHSPECVNRSQLTPCSMLSPLTPKLRSPTYPLDSASEYVMGRKEFSERGDRDPLNFLSVVDLASPLGKRASGIVARVVRDLHLPVCHDYEKFCNQLEVAAKTNSRQLRSFYGLVYLYRKRQNHRHVDRPFYMSKSTRRERMLTLFTGLNRRSRNLLKHIKKSYVRLTRLPELFCMQMRERDRRVSPSPTSLSVSSSTAASERGFQTRSQRVERRTAEAVVLQATPHVNLALVGHRKSARQRRRSRRLVDYL